MELPAQQETGGPKAPRTARQKDHAGTKKAPGETDRRLHALSIPDLKPGHGFCHDGDHHITLLWVVKKEKSFRVIYYMGMVLFCFDW